MFHYLLLVLSIITVVVGDQTKRCGTDWSDANKNCKQECTTDTNCTSEVNQKCFANLVTIPCLTNSTVRCGTTWENANTNCFEKCVSNMECPTERPSCFASLDLCHIPTPPSAPLPLVPISPLPCDFSHTLTLSELNLFMGRPSTDTDLEIWIEPLNYALAKYKMDCPMRIAAFLAQVRHETAGMKIFRQSLDNGAGVFHMIPANWKHACYGVPEISVAFSNFFPNCSNCSCAVAMGLDPFGTDANTAATQIWSQPLLSVLSGTWWFTTGASTPSIFGWKGCGDLRFDSDKGIGGEGSGDCYHMGYYQITCCIFWTIGGSSGLSQRLRYYDNALTIISNWSGPALETTQDGLPVPTIIGISIGVSFFVVIVVVVVILVIIRNFSPQSDFSQFA